MLLDDLQRAVAGTYTIKRELGGGGMSHVFLASENALGRDVVLKILPATLAEGLSAERFVREIRLAASLQQANIVPVLASGVAGDRPYYVMPFVDGESLRPRLQDARPVSVREAVAVLRDVARALAYAHKHGVVHRDIKPENILLSGDAAVVTDFGIAKALQASKTQAPGGTLTVVGTSIGTPAYMAPEQAAGDPAIDHRADIYAWGLIAYEMLAGRHAFAGKATPQQYLAAQLAEMPAPLQKVAKGVPLSLAALVMRCLAKDPGARPASATDLLEELEQATSAHASPAGGRGSRGLVLAALALVLLAGGAVGIWRDRRGAPPADAAVTRLAVLPFENRGRPEDDYFADGITDEVRGKLSSLPGLQVVARTSSAQYKKTTKSPADIARELGVDYLLTGTVQWEKGTGGSSGQVKVTPELVEVKRGATPVTKWQESLQAVISDVFKVQSDIAGRVAQKLDVALGSTERARLAARPTTNLEAYDAYLQGEEASDAMGKGDPASLQRAVRFYERATALDPGFAQAWARLSMARSYLYSNSVPDPLLGTQARAAAEQALAVAPKLPAGHVAMSLYQSAVAADPQRALAASTDALALAPADPDVLTSAARAERTAGRWEEAVAHGARAVALDPRAATGYRRGGETLVWLRRYAEGGALLERATALSPGNLTSRLSRALGQLGTGALDSARAQVALAESIVGRDATVAYFATYWDLGWVLTASDQDRVLALPPSAFDDDRASWALARVQLYQIRGDARLARAYADSAQSALAAQITANPRDAQLHSLRGVALAGLGQRDAAIAEATRGVAMMPVPRDAVQGPYMQLQLAKTYAILGDRDRAAELLETILDEKFFLSAAWLRIDPAFASLRGNPRFDRLIAAGT